jgi:hypothetical protein
MRELSNLYLEKNLNSLEPEVVQVINLNAQEINHIHPTDVNPGDSVKSKSQSQSFYGDISIKGSKSADEFDMDKDKGSVELKRSVFHRFHS